MSDTGRIFRDAIIATAVIWLAGLAVVVCLAP